MPNQRKEKKKQTNDTDADVITRYQIRKASAVKVRLRTLGQFKRCQNKQTRRTVSEVVRAAANVFVNANGEAQVGDAVTVHIGEGCSSVQSCRRPPLPQQRNGVLRLWPPCFQAAPSPAARYLAAFASRSDGGGQKRHVGRYRRRRCAAQLLISRPGSPSRPSQDPRRPRGRLVPANTAADRSGAPSGEGRACVF